MKLTFRGCKTMAVPLTKTLRVMTWSTLFIFLACLQVSANSIAQRMTYTAKGCCSSNGICRNQKTNGLHSILFLWIN